MNDLKMTKPQTEGKDFDPHPKGNYMAVCRDIYTKVEPNPFKGQISPYTGKVDEKETIKRIYFEFLTEEPIEINGDLKPRFVRYRAAYSWGEKSSQRKFVSGWDPDLGNDDYADLSVLVGRGAYLTITHNEGKDGKIYANVFAAAAPPKGASVPKIPADFVRYADRPENGGDGTPVGDDGLPF